MSIIRTHKRVQAAKTIGLLHKNTLTNHEVIEQMVKDTGLTKEKAGDVLSSLYKMLSKKKCEVAIHGFGKFCWKRNVLCFVPGVKLKGL